MPRSKVVTLVSVIAAFALIGGAIYLRSSSAESPKTASTQTTQEKPKTEGATSPEKKPEQKTLTLQELATNDGKDGHKCYVAVDGKVYEIEQGRLWKNGEHVTSQGQAHCGLDLSEVITKSPHGKAKLETLTVVGTLQQ
jgi:predicted heme/steroid binding protein